MSAFGFIIDDEDSVDTPTDAPTPFADRDSEDDEEKERSVTRAATITGNSSLLLLSTCSAAASNGAYCYPNIMEYFQEIKVHQIGIYHLNLYKANRPLHFVVDKFCVLVCMVVSDYQLFYKKTDIPSDRR